MPELPFSLGLKPTMTLLWRHFFENVRNTVLDGETITSCIEMPNYSHAHYMNRLVFAFLIALNLCSYVLAGDSRFDIDLALSKVEAAEKYPELRDQNSPFFKFVASTTNWLQANKPWIESNSPSPFEDPNWPLQVADSCYERMTKAIADQEKINVDKNVKTLQQMHQLLQLDKLGMIHLSEENRNAIQAFIVLKGGTIN
jgi:hypothetical protein